MKELTREEFEDRTQAVLRAHQIFIDSGVTNNISIAFELYQKVCAEREREIFLSAQIYGNRPKTEMDWYDRPKCPDCEADMMFRPVAENPTGIKVQLVCSKCDLVLGDEHDLKWWMENLKIKAEDGSTSVS
jgi:hypothetical protein